MKIKLIEQTKYYLLFLIIINYIWIVFLGIFYTLIVIILR